MKTVVKNISELIQTESSPRKWVAGKEMSKLSTIKDAFLEDHLDKLKQIAAELIQEQSNKKG